MAGTLTQPTAAHRALAAARVRTLGMSCSWSGAAATPMSFAPKAQGTKPATRTYVDAINHRTRRLRKPSP